MPKLLVSCLIILSLINTLSASDEKESKEWNEIKSSTSKFLDKSSTFVNHAFSDAKDKIDEFNKNEEIKSLKKDFGSYYDKISKDTKNIISKIKNSEEAETIRKKSKEIWTSIFGKKPKDSD